MINNVFFHCMRKKTLGVAFILTLYRILKFTIAICNAEIILRFFCKLYLRVQMGIPSVKKFINKESLQLESLSVKFIYNSCKINYKAVSVLRIIQKLLDEKSYNFRLAQFKLQKLISVSKIYVAIEMFLKINFQTYIFERN